MFSFGKGDVFREAAHMTGRLPELLFQVTPVLFSKEHCSCVRPGVCKAGVVLGFLDTQGWAKWLWVKLKPPWDPTV